MTQLSPTFARTLMSPHMRDADFEAFLNFDTRADYLEWRQSWKDAYATITQDIRAAKSVRKDPDDSIRGQAQCTRESLRILARNLLDLRQRSKVQAGARQAAARMVPA